PEVEHCLTSGLELAQRIRLARRQIQRPHDGDRGDRTEPHDANPADARALPRESPEPDRGDSLRQVHVRAGFDISVGIPAIGEGLLDARLDPTEPVLLEGPTETHE